MNIIELYFIDMRYDEGQYMEHNTSSHRRDKKKTIYVRQIYPYPMCPFQPLQTRRQTPAI